MRRSTVALSDLTLIILVASVVLVVSTIGVVIVGLCGLCGGKSSVRNLTGLDLFLALERLWSHEIVLKRLKTCF